MSANSHLILTVDYELFGNGTGNVDSCIINPARKMMEIAKDFSAPITFFAETTEFLAMANNAKSSENELKIRSQLVDAIKMNHDIQLHIHPQWYKAQYSSKNEWVLDYEKQRIGDLEEELISELIQEGKSYLQELYASVDLEYVPKVFRAGGWCIQPSRNVINALLQNGFIVDTSVAPENRENSYENWYNFRNSPKLPFWKSKSDILEATDSGIIEIPIASASIGFFKHFNEIFKNKREGSGFAQSCNGSYKMNNSMFKDYYYKIQKLFSLGTPMLDFSTYSEGVLIEVTKKWIQENRKTKILPIVGIAHTKNFTEKSEMNFKNYMKWAKREGIKFSKFDDCLEKLDV